MREIGLAVAGLLVLALVLQSCRASHYSDKADELRASLAVQREQVEACARSLEAVNAATEAEVAEAQRWAKEGQEAARAALQDAREAAERAEAARRSLSEAKREPTCREQLEVTLCESIPLY